MSGALEFQGQVALVTGAAQGIGLSVARMLAERGASVALLDWQAGALDAAMSSLPRAQAEQRHAAIVADLGGGSASLDAAVARAEQQLGPLDILASVAGILHLGAALDATDEDWNHTFAVNTTGVFHLCRAVARRMVPRKRGGIVVVGSNAASTPRLQMAAYAASKAATAQFLRCLALELAPHGIRCNLVSPGSTDTAMQRQLWSGPESAQAVIDGSAPHYRLGIPLGRIAQPEDIAEAVCFLASSRSRHITLHDLRVDGGATLDA